MTHVKHFLVVFDRARGEVLREQAFDDAQEALNERFRTEREHARADDIEVVVLTAESPEALRRTHARYFLTLSELADRTAI
jgi:hypothetical protein